MRDSFEQSLLELFDNLVLMGRTVDTAISEAINALLTKDIELAKKVVEGDTKINDLERKIEDQCMMIIIRQQPVASDLRMVSSALKMVTDMERVGDQAADISELVLSMLEDEIDYDQNDLGSIVAMSEATKEMLKKALQSFVDFDLDYSYQAIAMDEKVDDYYEKVKNEVVKDIKEESQKPNALIDFVLIAKYLERIGDHAQNIAEWVVYSITGEMKNFD